MTLMLPFFYTSSTPHARHICASFELWGWPFCSSRLVSFFRCCYERNSIHTTLLTNFISLVHLAHHLFFYPAVDGCWIHVNIGCSACIYNMPLVVSLNDEPWLTHRRWQSVGSAFQFCYTSFFKHFITFTTRFNTVIILLLFLNWFIFLSISDYFIISPVS